MTGDGHWMLGTIEKEMASIPAIEDLSDYIHLEDQLRQMRASQPEASFPYVLALQLALLFRLNEYDRRIGVPNLLVPLVRLDDGRRGHSNRFSRAAS